MSQLQSHPGMHNPHKIGSFSMNKNIRPFEDYIKAQRLSLPSLSDVEQLSPRVLRILGYNPSYMHLQGTNTYVLGTGSERIMIDTGEGRPEWAKMVAAQAEKHNFMITMVLLTHWHLDHTSGVLDLLHVYPHLEGCIYKCDPDFNQQPIFDGQEFMVAGASVRATFTPGHAADHMCFALEEENALFTGDNILGHGATVIEDLGQYTQALQTMLSQNCNTGYPGHGAMIRKLPLKLKQEIRRQQHREQQVLCALQRIQGFKPGVLATRHGATVSEIGEEAFGKLSDSLSTEVIAPLVRDILVKLAKEQRVGFAARQGNQRWFLRGGDIKVGPSPVRASITK